jgi:hypothetical protein
MNPSPILVEGMVVPGCGCAACALHRSAQRVRALQNKFGPRPQPDTWANP